MRRMRTGVLLLCASCFAACGGEGSSVEAESNESPSAQQEQSAEEVEGVGDRALVPVEVEVPGGMASASAPARRPPKTRNSDPTNAHATEDPLDQNGPIMKSCQCATFASNVRAYV